jgi:hypothetical protein
MPNMRTWARPRRPAWLGAVVLAAAAPEAWAAGGAHVVDDAAFVPAGTLQVEAWSAFALPGGQVLNLTAAGTLPARPRIEFSASVVGDNTAGAPRDVDLAGQVKILLRPFPEDGVPVGLALTAGHGIDARRGRSDTTALVGIVSLAPAPDLVVHANLGWEHGHEDGSDVAVWGLAADWEAGPGWMPTGELFGGGGQRTGVQAGVRRTLPGDRLDLDLLASRNLQGERATFVTLGATLRF